ncbi:hypothetical protein LR48_Vigan05g042200 [Vigna angularis]|uniref:Uncharacterized protein n=1 Tax=Phaseolus angularis TaxID=3914 RepID=A0A0L9UJ68_PHAAN|nr:hypothetical protein LR48_Vigan05g042200 [Vigna angularis]
MISSWVFQHSTLIVVLNRCKDPSFGFCLLLAAARDLQLSTSSTAMSVNQHPPSLFPMDVSFKHGGPLSVQLFFGWLLETLPNQARKTPLRQLKCNSSFNLLTASSPTNSRLEEHWKLGLRGRPGGSSNQKEKGRKEKGKREPEKKEDSIGEGPEREPVVEDQVLEGSLQENSAETHVCKLMSPIGRSSKWLDQISERSEFGLLSVRPVVELSVRPVAFGMSVRPRKRPAERSSNRPAKRSFKCLRTFVQIWNVRPSCAFGLILLGVR